MGLTNIRLGDYIERSTINNKDLKYGGDLIVGVNSQGVFATPKRNTDGVDLKPYKIVENGAFVYNPTRLELGSIAYRTEGLCIVSHLYMVFYLTDEGKKIIDPMWLYIYFRRSEFCREVKFRNFGSQRPEFNFNDMSDIVIPLPDIELQKKYVDIYNAMLENQKSYERGLDDLKLVCNAYIENLSNCKQEKIGKYVERNKKKNQDVNFSKCDVKGFNNEGQFIEPMRLFSGDISTFKIISKDDLVYNSRINSTIKRLSIVINEGKNLIVSPAYESFKVVKEKELCPFYLYMLLQRESFARKVLFNSFGSSTIVFGFDDLCEIEIPVPSFSEQESIANMYRLYKERWNINEKLKEQIKGICPILIKGSIEEARQAKEA